MSNEFSLSNSLIDSNDKIKKFRVFRVFFVDFNNVDNDNDNNNDDFDNARQFLKLIIKKFEQIFAFRHDISIRFFKFFDFSIFNDLKSFYKS